MDDALATAPASSGPAGGLRRALPWLLTLLWAALVAAGFGALAAYKARPGAQQAAPAVWPRGSRLSRSEGRMTLLMAAHPHCPCTRASLHELQEIVERAGDKLDATALFVRPDDMPEGWERGALWQAAEATPGLRVVSDPGGVEASRFGALTSGQAVLYDAQGKLVFQGGITGSRGHEGDNDGRRAVLSRTEGKPQEASSPVYGCSLRGPDAPEAGAP